jgi:D-alanine-D-alanine ligase
MDRNELKNKRIAVLMGGLSSEREVSLTTGRAVARALRARGYRPLEIDVGADVAKRLLEEGVEVAFIALHGRYGEDGCIQGLLETLKIPYTGSGVTASALGMDKIRSRWIFERHGLPVPPYRVLDAGQAKQYQPGKDGPGFPLVVKPYREGSSVGVTIVRRMEDLPAALESALAFDPLILVERHIPGREIQVGILDDEPLGAIEIRPKRGFYDYEAKYTDGLADHLLPAPLPEPYYTEALNLALAAHRVLGCEGGTRVDLLFMEGEGFYLLEVNTLPGMTPLSLLPEIAKGAGLSFEELCERILLGARLKA